MADENIYKRLVRKVDFPRRVITGAAHTLWVSLSVARSNLALSSRLWRDRRIPRLHPRGALVPASFSSFFVLFPFSRLSSVPLFSFSLCMPSALSFKIKLRVWATKMHFVHFEVRRTHAHAVWLTSVTLNIARPADAAGYMFCCCSLFLTIFSNQLSEHLLDWSSPNFHSGRTMAVDDQYEISFSIPLRTLPWQPIFVGFIHRTGFRWHSADGVSAYGKKCNWFAGRRQLVAQPGGLTLGFAPHLVIKVLLQRQSDISLLVHRLLYTSVSCARSWGITKFTVF